MENDPKEFYNTKFRKRNAAILNVITPIKNLEGYPTPAFHFWPKFWEKPKKNSHQVWTFYLLPFST